MAAQGDFGGGLIVSSYKPACATHGRNGGQWSFNLPGPESKPASIHGRKDAEGFLFAFRSPLSGLVISPILLRMNETDTPTIATEVQVMFFDTDCAGVVHNIA